MGQTKPILHLIITQKIRTFANIGGRYCFNLVCKINKIILLNPSLNPQINPIHQTCIPAQHPPFLSFILCFRRILAEYGIVGFDKVGKVIICIFKTG
jgi:hypothetical protein